MPDFLTATSSVLCGVRPSLDESGNIARLMIDIALSYSDQDGVPSVGRTVTFDAWELMTESQRLAMQDIQNTLQTYIAATYFA